MATSAKPLVSIGNATPDQVLSGATFSSDSGLLQTGNAQVPTPEELALATATPDKVLSGYTFYGGDDKEIKTGTALATASTAAVGDIVSGKTAYNNLGQLLTGTNTNTLSIRTGTLTWKGTNYTTSGAYNTYTNTWTIPVAPLYLMIGLDTTQAYTGSGDVTAWLCPAEGKYSNTTNAYVGSYTLSGKTLTHKYTTSTGMSSTTRTLRYILIY